MKTISSIFRLNNYQKQRGIAFVGLLLVCGLLFYFFYDLRESKLDDAKEIRKVRINAQFNAVTQN